MNTEKDFDEFVSLMKFRFTNDVPDLIKANEEAGGYVSSESIGAAYSVTLYLLKAYHEWLNES